MTHLDYDRQSPVWRHWVRELSRGRTLIRYDERGCGLSDRELEATPTLDTYVGDLAAVVDAAQLERFALMVSPAAADRDRVHGKESRARHPSRPLRQLHTRALPARRRRGRAVAAADRANARGLGRRCPGVPAGIQLDLHPKRRRAAEALVRRHAAGVKHRRSRRTALAVAHGHRHQRHDASHRPAGALSYTRATTEPSPTRRDGASRRCFRTHAS